MARPGAPAPSAALLPSVLPSVCVGGVLLCGGSVVTLPTPPPVPVPSVCVGPACTGDVIGPGNPGANPPPTGSGPRPAPGVSSTATTGPAAASTAAGTTVVAAAAPLPAPPGVGLVRVPNGVVQDSLSPDALATVLSLSLSGGLNGFRYHVWPWLLAIQLVLWTAIAAVVWSRRLSSPAPSRRS